ncbi:transposase [Streptomyces collinus]|uniref:transposase n=1 Tax=Streptomyces collinus TaxID=42684 RepID=UPI0036E50980
MWTGPGVQWRYLPHDFPHWNTVYGYFAKRQKEGVFAQLNGLLRRLLRDKEGRDAEPSACVIDAQSVKTSRSVSAADRGIYAGKKTWAESGTSSPTPSVSRLPHSGERAELRGRHQTPGPGRRRTPRHPQGVGRRRLPPAPRRAPATLGIDMEFTARTPGPQGFTQIPKRWAVERTYGWLMLREHHLPARPDTVDETVDSEMKQREKTTSKRSFSPGLPLYPVVFSMPGCGACAAGDAD